MLIDKLEKYGIRGEELNLMKSYLSNRKQVVLHSGSVSSKMNQNIGVVQGSRLGPLLYDIYSNDFNYLCANDENILYADDTCLVYLGDDIASLASHVNMRLEIINDWCNSNKLFLNRTKSEYMVITNRVINTQPDLFIGTDKLSKVENFKYLGVFIDASMKFHSHIEATKVKLSQICGAAYRLKDYMSLNAAKKVYFSGFYATASYCIAVYGGVLMCTQRGEVLQKIQNKIVKNLFSRFFPRSANLYRDVGILRLADIYKLRVSLYMYKVLFLNDCPTIRNNLRISYPNHNYSTRTRHNLLLPFPRVETIRINFQYQFVNIWNSIPENLKVINSIKVFKKSLIKLYLESYTEI